MSSNFGILMVALIVDFILGDPPIIWRKIPHPVVVFGWVINWLDIKLNRQNDTPEKQQGAGGIAIFLAICVAGTAAVLVDNLLALFGDFEIVGRIIIISIFLAQKSLITHVSAVADALSKSGITAGRKSVAMIVGRSVEDLDESEVSAASIETLAENFSDGVIAPAFWFLIFGLPGLFIYKMINTADSMIAYRNEKYEHFGFFTARIDDWANWTPARISGWLIVFAGSISTLNFKKGMSVFKYSYSGMRADAPKHRSPNAGWPESAMAYVLDVRISGPRNYDGQSSDEPYINEAGKKQLTPNSIYSAVRVFTFSCVLFVAILAIFNDIWPFL